MHIVKISVLLLSQDIARSYKEREKGDFWEDLSAGMKKALAPESFTENKRGNVQNLFCVTTEQPGKYYRALAEKLLAGMLPDPAERSRVILSVTEAAEETAGRTEDSAVIQNPEEKTAKMGDEACAQSLTLAGQAKRISAFREGLLSKVRGQRHAVDELVQSIFECEKL